MLEVLHLCEAGKALQVQLNERKCSETLCDSLHQNDSAAQASVRGHCIVKGLCTLT